MRQIGDYTIEDQPIGTGGMGRVYRGYDASGLPVAIKEILPQFVRDMEFIARLKREIKILKGLDNDNITKVHGYFNHKENMYIVMELVEGVNVEQWVAQQGPMPLNLAAECMVKVLDTMQYVHAKGIIHRDIKPSNIMIRPDGNVCLLDFGIAKDTNTSTGQTVMGMVLGTNGYMSPEQLTGMAVDHRTDIYALGCLMFYMLTGQHAYINQGSELEMHKQIMTQPLPQLSAYGVNAPAAQNLLLRATDKNMLKRFQSCMDFKQALIRECGVADIPQMPAKVQPTVTVGREGCDIIVYTDRHQVSRHHLKVQLRELTGGSLYVLTDTSSNGTLVNGTLYTRGMSVNLPIDRKPSVYLANDPNLPLDWDSVVMKINEQLRSQGFTGAEGDTVPAPGSGVAYPPTGGGAYPPTGGGAYPPPGGGAYPPPHGGGGAYPPPPGGSAAYPPPPGGSGAYPPPPGSKGSGTSRNVASRAGKELSFFDAVSICFKKYADFNGRASRAEYWWFVLFNIIGNAIFGILTAVIGDFVVYASYVFSLAIMLPGLAVATRRLHDIGKAGTLLLLLLIPIANFFIGIWLIILLCKQGEPGPNKYGNPVE